MLKLVVQGEEIVGVGVGVEVEGWCPTLFGLGEHHFGWLGNRWDLFFRLDSPHEGGCLRFITHYV